MAGAAVQIIQMSVVFNFVLSVLSSGWPWGHRGQVQASAGGSRSEDGPCRDHCGNYGEQEFGVCLHAWVLLCVCMCVHFHMWVHMCAGAGGGQRCWRQMSFRVAFPFYSLRKVLSLNLELTDLPRLSSQRAIGSFLTPSSCFSGLGLHICALYTSNK